MFGVRGFARIPEESCAQRMTIAQAHEFRADLSVVRLAGSIEDRRRGKSWQTSPSPLNRKRPAQMVSRFSHRGTPRGLEVAVKGEVLQEAEGLHL
jgi:hypothetical protein